MEDQNTSSQIVYKKLGIGNLVTYNYGRKFIIANTDTHKVSINGNVYKFTDILDVETISETVHNQLADAIINSQRKSNTGSVIKRSVVGGIVAGPVGAVIGGLTTPSEVYEEHPSAHVEITKLIVTVNDYEKPTEIIEAEDDLADEKELVNIANFFKTILINNRSKENCDIKSDTVQQSISNTLGNNSQTSRAEDGIKDLLVKAHKSKNMIKEFGFYRFDDKIKQSVNRTKSLYNQILAFDSNSQEAMFYCFYFDCITDEIEPDRFKRKYLEKCRPYLMHISESDDFNAVLEEFVEDSYKIVDYIDANNVQPVRAGYFLLLELGDLLESMFGDKCKKQSIELWEDGIAFHHRNGNHKREDFKSYIEKIKAGNINYLEPNNRTGCLGIVLFAIIFSISGLFASLFL